jgi:polysaccharide biosynthesis transport protein
MTNQPILNTNDLWHLIHWKHLRQLALENQRILIICGCIGFILGACYLFTSPPAYESKITLEVGQESSKILHANEARKQDWQRQDTLKTIEQNLLSQALFLRVVKNHQVRGNQDFVTQRLNKPWSDAQLARALAGMVSVKLRRGTRLIDVSVRHKSAAMSGKLVKALVHEFIRQDLELNSGMAETTFAFLVEESERLRNKLQNSEKAIRDYQSSDQRHIDEISKKSAEFEAEIALLSTRYKDKHPKLLFSKKQLAECKTLLQTIPHDNQSLKAGSYVSFDVLSREHDADRMLYDSILKQLKETQVTKSFTASTPITPGPALTSDRAQQPSKLKILFMTVAGGFMASFGVIFMRSALNNSIRSIDQAEDVLQLPVLAAIPRKELPLKSHGQHLLTQKHLLTYDNPQCMVAEAFRSLRASLTMNGGAKQPKVVLFAGAVPSEGKSFCCANYAVSLAKQGIRTLIIDADLRKPRIASMFLECAELNGISNFLSSNKRLEECIFKTSVPDLSVMPAGSRLELDPTDLLSRKRFSELIQESLQTFDRVVLDTAPLLSVRDTLLITEYAEAVFLVVQAAKTPRQAILRALKILDRANVKPSGVILNGVSGYDERFYQYQYGTNDKSYQPIYGLQSSTT